MANKTIKTTAMFVLAVLIGFVAMLVYAVLVPTLMSSSSNVNVMLGAIIVISFTFGLMAVFIKLALLFYKMFNTSKGVLK